MHKRGKSHLNMLVQRHLSEILLRQSNDPRFRNVTVSRVETSSDMSFAKVHVSIFPSDKEQELINSLNRAAGFFSRQLGHALRTRNTPRLQFIYDPGFDYSTEIETLIKNHIPPVKEADSG